MLHARNVRYFIFFCSASLPYFSEVNPCSLGLREIFRELLQWVFYIPDDMPFQSPNRQCPSAEGIALIDIVKLHQVIVIACFFYWVHVYYFTAVQNKTLLLSSYECWVLVHCKLGDCLTIAMLHLLIRIASFHVCYVLNGIKMSDSIFTAQLWSCICLASNLTAHYQITYCVKLWIISINVF